MYVLGLAGTLIGIIGAIPYIYNTLRRKTKPHRVSWIIYLILSLINFSSQFSLGAKATLIFFGWAVINNLILVGLSLRKNNGYGNISFMNIICFVLALLAISLWKITGSPFIALICVIFADGIGSLLIVVKSYKHPESETVLMWALGIMAGLLNILAVGKLDPYLLAAPLYIFIFDILIVGAILLGRSKHKAKRK